jgi:ABC-type lipoprotein release transport system permease subunit
MRITLWLGELRDDLKYALRQLKNSPAFTLVATLTLALGIGANSAIFALVDATIEKMLFGVRPLDMVTLAFVTIVLGITAALSVAGPAWRAARIDPSVALRNP